MSERLASEGKPRATIRSWTRSHLLGVDVLAGGGRGGGVRGREGAQVAGPDSWGHRVGHVAAHTGGLEQRMVG